MGLYGRQYWQDGQSNPQGGTHYARHLPSKPGIVAKWLLGINVAVFVLQAFSGGRIESIFAVVPAYWWQVWRYLTFQFLHASMMHILFNMLGLYFLGVLLEYQWGGRKFLIFYLVCGAFAGLSHVLLSLAFGQDTHAQLMGASGGVYAVVIACAVLFPQVRVLFFFIFPMTILTAAFVFIVISLWNVITGIISAFRGGPLSYSNVSEIAHLGGAAAAAVWLLVWPWLARTGSVKRIMNTKTWSVSMRRRRAEFQEIDRILQKIHEQGINSLTWLEKRRLRRASRRQQRRDE